MHVPNFFLQGEVSNTGLPQFLIESGGYFGNSVDSNQLVVWINSSGGDLLAATEAINLIRSSPVPVTTIINGHAESAALLIAMAGHRRLAYNTSWGMVHHFATAMEGSYHELQDFIKHNALLHDLMQSMFTRFSKMTASEVETIALGRQTTWLSAEEMLKYGIIDAIIDEENSLQQVLDYKVGKDGDSKKKKRKT